MQPFGEPRPSVFSDDPVGVQSFCMLEMANGRKRLVPERAIGIQLRAGSVEQLLQYAHCGQLVSNSEICIVHLELSFPLSVLHGRKGPFAPLDESRVRARAAQDS
jgi:hypothetical protein